MTNKQIISEYLDGIARSGLEDKADLIKRHKGYIENMMDEARKSEQKCKTSRLVTPDNYWGVEEWYIPVIECPKCKHKMPAIHTNYCSGCGVKLKLSATVQKKADKDW